MLQAWLQAWLYAWLQVQHEAARGWGIRGEGGQGRERALSLMV